VLPAFHHKTYTICLCLDLKKAFDTVNKDILLAKLNFYDIKGYLNKLINIYILDRYQYVICNSAQFKVLPARVGVLQGSELRPLFFSIFINNITDMSSADVILFTDNAVFYVNFSLLADAV
ncbi:Reverse transcriptase domain, partial [Trinorchestia longiramus]